jgi:hypothetical protein
LTDGILHIDGFNWSLIKHSSDDFMSTSPEKRKARLSEEDETFKLYHERVRAWITAGGGEVWNTVGDCTIAHRFDSVDEAVATATSIQRRLTDFNVVDNRLGSPLLVRIGVGAGTLPDVPVEQRGETSVAELDAIAHIQKVCPPGRVRISREVYERLRFSRHDFRPALSTDERSSSLGSMVWVDRMLTPHDLEGIKRLTPRQGRSYPPVALTSVDLTRLGFSGDLRDVRNLLSKSLAVLGETRSGRDESDPVSHPAATSDAIGAIEVFAAIASSSGVFAAIDEWDDTVDLATQHDLVIVGSPAVNLFAYAVNRVLNAGFEESEDRPMRVRITSGGQKLLFPSSYEHGVDDPDYGIVAIDRSPINPQQRVLWIAGLSGMATQAAAQLTRDLVMNPTSVLSESEAGYPSVAVVKPKWRPGYGSADYQGRWRVSGYEVVWSGRQY